MTSFREGSESDMTIILISTTSFRFLEADFPVSISRDKAHLVIACELGYKLRNTHHKQRTTGDWRILADTRRDWVTHPEGGETPLTHIHHCKVNGTGSHGTGSYEPDQTGRIRRDGPLSTGPGRDRSRTRAGPEQDQGGTRAGQHRSVRGRDERMMQIGVSWFPYTHR